MLPSISSDRLACTSATATSTVNPIPSESTTRAAGAPGRCRLARARRSTIRRGRPTRRAAATIRVPARRNTAKEATAPATYHNATARSVAVSNSSAASATPARQAPTNGPSGTPRGAGATISRNNAPGITRPTAASGGSANSSTASAPYAAASASGAGCRPARNGTGSSLTTNGATVSGTRPPSTKPTPIPTAARMPICAA
jgi:hypothetical protein